MRHNFNPRAPCGARRHDDADGVFGADISIHAPHAGRDYCMSSEVIQKLKISIHAPHAGRDVVEHFKPLADKHFNPRAPCGARPAAHSLTNMLSSFQSTRPMRGATLFCFRRAKYGRYFNPRAPCGARLLAQDSSLISSVISIHAPHAGRDSKSIQNYFKHFCDKRQFLDNFTQNTAFQSVLPLADRQKLLYLRCEPLRKFLRAFASHYKIIGSSGR